MKNRVLTTLLLAVFAFGGVAHARIYVVNGLNAVVGASTLLINDVRLDEGNSGTRNAVFTVTLSSPQEGEFTVQFATQNSTATAGSDYNSTSGTLTFASGETIKTLTVPVRGDTIAEPDETFFVRLFRTQNDGEGGVIVTTLGRGTGTIANDDSAALPTLSVNDVSGAEGTGGTTIFAFTVTLSNAANEDVTFNFRTVDNEAFAPADFTMVNKTVTIPAGETLVIVNVPIVTDNIDESDEIFTVALTNPSGATLERAEGTGFITDDDTSTLSINNVRVTEGNSGTKNAVFTAKLSNPRTNQFSVDFATEDGTAAEGSDYNSANGGLTFLAGETSKTINVPVRGDTNVEPDETFFVVLSQTFSDGEGGTQVRELARGTGTIANDDQIAALPTLSINNVAVSEGNAGTTNAVFTVTLSAASTTPVTVDFATANGTAAASDFTARTGTLTIPAGQTKGTISVVVKGDTVVEPDETFFVNLSNAQNATIADNRGLGRITNDDNVVAQRADLEVTQTVTPAAVAVGQTAVFTITVKNNGPTNATGVVLNDTLPSGSTFLSASPAAASNANGVLHFNLGALNVGQSRVIRLKLRLNTPGSATNTAIAGSPISDPAQANNTAAATAPVGAQIVTPQITITSSSFVPIGGYLPGLFTPRRVAQTLMLRNNGPALRAPISLILDAFGSNAKLSNAAGKTTTAQSPAGRPFVAVPAGSDNLLSTGESVTVRLEFAVSGSGNPTYTPVIIAGAGAR